MEEVDENNIEAGTDGDDREEDVIELDVAEEECEILVRQLVEHGLLSWSNIAEEMLHALQPPQTATHVPQLAGIRREYAARERWAPARRWMYAQYGRCASCGRLTSLCHDHILGRDILASQADYLENLRFLCRRCNQSRHWEHGGRLKWGTAAAVQYLLHQHKPRKLSQLTDLGRRLGLTQSGQRFEEAWALAVFRSRHNDYDIDEIHPQISIDDVEGWRRYYEEMNHFFGDLDAELRATYPEQLAVAKDLQLLITTRSTTQADRIAAARRVGLYNAEAIRPIVDKPKRNDAERHTLLQASGHFDAEEISEIIMRKRVALFHLLDHDTRADLLDRIERVRTECRQRHRLE